MKKLTLLSAVFLLGIMLTQVGFANGTYKYSSKPHLRIQSAQTALDAIYIPVNVPVSDVRVSLHAKVVMYSSLRITLRSPLGVSVVLKEESGNASATPLYGSLGTERSHLLFQDGGNGWGQQPNDQPIAPKNPLALMNGVLSQGWWQLEIKDERSFAINAIPQDGYLEAWSLNFNEQIVEPVQPFNPAVNALWAGGANLFGQINGVAAQFGDPNNLAQIPNDGTATNPGSQCNYPNDPAVLVGLNGDCFPIEISGHPGALIGTDANGYPAGRFRITITVEPTYPASPYAGFTEDIAIYFGRVPDAALNLPLPAPPSMGDPGYKAEQYIGGWPTGSATVTSSLEGPSAAFGGVRLGACVSPAFSDDYGYDRVTFDDLALVQIDNGVGVPPAPTLPPIFTGPFKPMQPLSSLDGSPVDGLYYVTVYDAFNDNESGPDFGHIRVTYLQVEYIIGGGEVPNPERHQGFVGPLAGVPVPGTISGTPFGYLSDAIGMIPPYKEHAKAQDPMLMFWSTQKMYPRDAVGTERIMAVDQNNYAPVINYHGPYAYPGLLDADPTKAGSFVNADVLLVPEGDYNFRVNLMQARYDDDLADNEYESPEINVNPVSVSYHGDQVVSWNKFVDPEHVGLIASANIPPGLAIGNAFSLFGSQTVKVSSVDFKFDDGTIVTPRSNCQISVWNLTNGLTGTPNQLVARSTMVNVNSYIEGNYRTFPIYPVDANGNPDINAGGSVDLPAGTYVVVLDNVGNSDLLIYPYTFGAIPSLKDRYYDYMFTDNFGPVGPTSVLGTYFTYISGDITAAPFTSFAAPGAQNVFGNYVAPMRVNMTTMNDFSVNVVRFSSQNSPTEAIAVNQQVTPMVNITANSDQGGLKKDCNIYLGIYDAGNNLLYSDMVNIANPPYNGISGFETITVNMDPWTPAGGGQYTVKAYFTRNPDDQNAVNDMIVYPLYVQAAPVIAYDVNVDHNALNELVDVVTARGEDPTLVNISEDDLSTVTNSTIYFLGDMDAAAQTELGAAIAKGNDVAFVYTDNSYGQMVEKIDNLYGIERASAAQYASMAVAPSLTAEADARAVNFDPTNIPTIRTKEELLSYMSSPEAKIEPMHRTLEKSDDVNSMFDTALPIAQSSQYGAISFLSEKQGSLGIVYTIPSNRKAGSIAVDDAAPTAFALGQNYPNPFNPTTTISYTIAENSVVTLRVIDVLGREIATLVNQTQEAGNYSISWKGLDMNGIDVPTGTYLYRIDAVPASGGATFSSTKKMVLSK